MSTNQLFGTDGVRGVAGEELTADLARSLGRAVVVAVEATAPRVLIVRDTRESGPMLEGALAEGIAEAGGEAVLAGVLPTPAAAILARDHGYELAAVISASHNPWQDNGIKFFGSDGQKLGDEVEERIEALVAQPPPVADPPGTIASLEGALGEYVNALTAAFPESLGGVSVVLDCANGATFEAAPAAFERLGATVHVIGCEPDGRNINLGAGSTAPEALAAAVVEHGAAIGFAFDGDGDRLIAVDAAGEVRDGDEMIALVATRLARTGGLGGGVVVTVMSNYGFHAAMNEARIEVATTPVGDRHVGAELQARGWLLGGEQSGHLIFTPYAPTGDGIAAALLTLRALQGEPLAESIPMRRLPQTLVNVRIAERDAIADATEVWSAVEAESSALEGRGRILVRPSGTEPLVRVMVEAPTREECEQVCARLVAIVEDQLT